MCSDEEAKFQIEKEMEVMYGKDAGCVDWDAKSHLQPRGMYVVYDFEGGSSFTEQQRLKKVQYLLHYRFYMFLLENFGPTSSPSSILFHPAEAPDWHGEALRSAATVRSKLIQPRFGSVKSFWQQFEQYFYEKAEWGGYDLPPDEPSLSVKQMRDLVKKEGDSFGTHLAEMLLMMYQDDQEISSIWNDHNYDWCNDN